jgi:Probable cobalt transporter subunit (CbtB)
LGSIDSFQRRPYRRLVGNVKKAVQIRRGRATVSEGVLRALSHEGLASQTFLSGATNNGTRHPGGHDMSNALYVPAAEPAAIPVRDILPWLVFGGLLALLAIYFVGAEQGATALISGHYIHEYVHDGRHLLGFPCH